MCWDRGDRWRKALGAVGSSSLSSPTSHRLALQEVDAVLPAHEVCVTAVQLVAEPGQLLLRIQADHRLAAFQQVAEEQLEQVALALAGVAQDEHAGIGLVRCAAVQIQQESEP